MSKKLIINKLTPSQMKAIDQMEETMVFFFPRHCGKTALVDAVKEMKMDHNPTEALKSAFEAPSIINKHF